MNKLICVIFFIVLSSASLAQSEKAKIYFVLANLNPTQKNILERVFFSEVEKLSKEYSEIEFIKIDNVSIMEIINILSSRSTMGAIFLGHPAINTKVDGDERKIIHAYLQTSYEKMFKVENEYRVDLVTRYVPKRIFTASHENIKILSIITCHDSVVTPLYKKNLPAYLNTYFITSPTHNIDSFKNPLFEFTSFYSTPEILGDFKNKIPSLIKEFRAKRKFEKTEEVSKIKISWRDQLSKFYVYEVLLNGKLVGVLEPYSTSRKRSLNKREMEIKVSVPIKSGDVITISPDDPNRPRSDINLKVVDDIIVDRVEIVRESSSENVVLGQAIHIGDEKNQPDAGTSLTFLRNEEGFLQSIFYLNKWDGIVP